MKKTFCVLALAVVSFVACAEEKTTTVTFGKDTKYTMSVPESWKSEKPAGTMRMLQMKVPKQKDDADDAELAVFFFPAGGGVDANVKRWAGQFGGDNSVKVKRTAKTASGVEATVVELEGTYTAMSPLGGAGTPKANYKLLGAIVINNTGEYYLKLTGPALTIDQSKAAFDKMVESLK